MRKDFCYTFLNKTCPICNTAAVKDFWTFYGTKLHENHSYCPNCKKKMVDDEEKEWVIAKDPEWKQIVRDGALYILRSTEKTFVRTVQNDELFKKHYVEANWFFVGKKVYIESFNLLDKEIVEFALLQPDGMTLVFLPNSHLQRLYFFVPTDALR